MSAKFPLTVYYDRACPLCREEIGAIMRADSHHRLRLADISAPNFNDPHVSTAGISQHDLMMALHVRDANGNWYKAVDAFVHIYAAVEIESVSRLWANAYLRPLWDRLYPIIARHRKFLSRLGLARPMRWLIDRAARRAARNRVSCQLPHHDANAARFEGSGR